MSNNKQSSVEWLAEIIRFANKELYAEMFDEIEQAKAMHKEEIEHFFKMGMLSLVEGKLWKPIDKFEQYYNEIFGGEK